MRRMRALRALCSCLGSRSRPAHPEDDDGSEGTVHEAVTTLAAVGTSLLQRLQDRKGDRLETYRELEGALQGQDGCLQKSGLVNRLIAEASKDLRAAQGVTDGVRMAAGDVLVALARSHFHFVMPELQSHLKAMRKDPSDEAVLLTLAKMAHSYALRCIPFVGMTLLTLRAVLSRVGSGGILRAVCGVLEQWSQGVNTYFCIRERCPFPGKGEAQLCADVYPVFGYVVANWLDCEEEEDKQAVLGAVAAMTRVLLHDERHRQHACEQLPWLLRQYEEVRDTSLVTKSLNYVLEKLEGLETPLSQGTVLAVSTAVHRQLSDMPQEPDPAHKAVLTRCIVLQAQTCPEEMTAFLQSQLSAGSPRGRAAAVGLLGVLARSKAPAAREKLPQVVQAVWSVCKDPSAKVQLAVVQFIRELLSCVPQRCWAWDVVGHVFDEFTRTSGRLAMGGVFAWETPEDEDIRALCMDIVGSLDVSLPGMSKLLWPRLLQYLVPSKYSDMLIPLSRCLRALAERRERAGCEEEEEPDATDSEERARLPAPQVLLAQLLVVAAAPHTSSERTVAALHLLRAVHSWIHRALGAVWATEIPLLLQELEGNAKRFPGSAEWEQRVLKFLRTSLEAIEDRAWTVGLSQELSQRLGSSVPSSWNEIFLYKALGTALAACRDLRYVQDEILRFLSKTIHVKLSEAQGIASVVSHIAESHFHLVVDTLTMFHDQVSMDLMGQEEQESESAQATCAALMLVCSRVALRAPKDQLLTRVDKELMGNILRLSRAEERGLRLKLALVQSITEISSAIIQAGGDRGSFELSSKQEAMQTLLDWIEEEPWDSQIYGVFQVLEELSKLRPPLSREDNDNLLGVCCRCVLSYPPKNEMDKGRKMARADRKIQLLHERHMEDLGHLIETLLKAEASSACFDDVVHVLKGWLTSSKAWKQERALWVCARVLGALKEDSEFMKGQPNEQLGFLVGLLASLTFDGLATSRQKAWVCLSYLLQMQAKTVHAVPQADEIERLCEELEGQDSDSVAKPLATVAKAVCSCIPPAQAMDFLATVLHSLRHVGPTSVKAVWQWVFFFLVERRKEILPELSRLLTILHAYAQKSTHTSFALHAESLLIRFHREPMVSHLLQRDLPMDSETVELWRSLGRNKGGIHVLSCLGEKLNQVANRLGSISARARHNPQAALEALTITRAITEVVYVLRHPEELKQVLPELLPSLLRWATETLGEERLPSPNSSWIRLFLEGRILEKKPCRLFLEALERVLDRCMPSKCMQLLMHGAAWARLEDPLAHLEGVCLLSSVLLQTGLVSPALVKNFLPWLDSCSVKLQVTARAFLAELPQDYRPMETPRRRI